MSEMSTEKQAIWHRYVGYLIYMCERSRLYNRLWPLDWLRQLKSLLLDSVKHGIHDVESLVGYMHQYYKLLKPTLEECLTKQMRYKKLKIVISNHLLLFYIIYSHLNQVNKSILYCNEMKSLIKLYMKAELSSYVKSRESESKSSSGVSFSDLDKDAKDKNFSKEEEVASRITSTLSLFLDNRKEAILDVITRDKLLKDPLNRQIYQLIIYNIVHDSYKECTRTDGNYIERLLSFKLWLSCNHSDEVKDKIIEMAVADIKAPGFEQGSIVMDLFEGELRAKPTLDQSNITRFLMTAPFSIKRKIRAYNKIIKNTPLSDTYFDTIPQKRFCCVTIMENVLFGTIIPYCDNDSNFINIFRLKSLPMILMEGLCQHAHHYQLDLHQSQMNDPESASDERSSVLNENNLYENKDMLAENSDNNFNYLNLSSLPLENLNDWEEISLQDISLTDDKRNVDDLNDFQDMKVCDLLSGCNLLHYRISFADEMDAVEGLARLSQVVVESESTSDQPSNIFYKVPVDGSRRKSKKTRTKSSKEVILVSIPIDKLSISQRNNIIPNTNNTHEACRDFINPSVSQNNSEPCDGSHILLNSSTKEYFPQFSDYSSDPTEDSCGTQISEPLGVVEPLSKATSKNYFLESPQSTISQGQSYSDSTLSSSPQDGLSESLLDCPSIKQESSILSNNSLEDIKNANKTVQLSSESSSMGTDTQYLIGSPSSISQSLTGEDGFSKKSSEPDINQDEKEFIVDHQNTHNEFILSSEETVALDCGDLSVDESTIVNDMLTESTGHSECCQPGFSPISQSIHDSISPSKDLSKADFIETNYSQSEFTNVPSYKVFPVEPSLDEGINLNVSIKIVKQKSSLDETIDDVDIPINNQVKSPNEFFKMVLDGNNAESVNNKVTSTIPGPTVMLDSAEILSPSKENINMDVEPRSQSPAITCKPLYGIFKRGDISSHKSDFRRRFKKNVSKYISVDQPPKIINDAINDCSINSKCGPINDLSAYAEKILANNKELVEKAIAECKNDRFKCKPKITFKSKPNIQVNKISTNTPPTPASIPIKIEFFFENCIHSISGALFYCPCAYCLRIWYKEKLKFNKSKNNHGKPNEKQNSRSSLPIKKRKRTVENSVNEKPIKASKLLNQTTYPSVQQQSMMGMAGLDEHDGYLKTVGEQMTKDRCVKTFPPHSSSQNNRFNENLCPSSAQLGTKAQKRSSCFPPNYDYSYPGHPNKIPLNYNYFSSESRECPVPTVPVAAPTQNCFNKNYHENQKRLPDKTRSVFTSIEKLSTSDMVPFLSGQPLHKIDPSGITGEMIQSKGPVIVPSVAPETLDNRRHLYNLNYNASFNINHPNLWPQLAPSSHNYPFPCGTPHVQQELLYVGATAPTYNSSCYLPGISSIGPIRPTSDQSKRLAKA